jgi:hypothetical protein
MESPHLMTRLLSTSRLGGGLQYEAIPEFCSHTQVQPDHVKQSFYPAKPALKHQYKTYGALLGLGALLAAGGVYFEPGWLDNYEFIARWADSSPSSEIPMISKIVGIATGLVAITQLVAIKNDADNGLFIDTEAKQIGAVNSYGGEWIGPYLEITDVTFEPSQENPRFGHVDLEVLMAEPLDLKSDTPGLSKALFRMPVQEHYAEIAKRLLAHAQT